MGNKCATPKCFSGYASNEKKQIAKFHLPLNKQSKESKKQWIRFVNRRDWIARSAVSITFRRNIYGEVKNVHHSAR